MIAQKYKGLRPFPAAPPAPAVKPVDLNGAKPPVISRVPTSDKIVFLTIDDGIEKDPRFVQMVKDFQIPFTLFLTDQMIRDDYGYFTQLLDTGMAKPPTVEALGPSIVWLARQGGDGFTGQVLETDDFSKTWGPNA